MTVRWPRWIRGAALGGYLGFALGVALSLSRVGFRLARDGPVGLDYEVLMIASLVEVASLSALGIALGGALRVLARPWDTRAATLLPGVLLLLLLGTRIGLGLLAQASTRPNRLPVRPDEPLPVIIALAAIAAFHLWCAPAIAGACRRRPRSAVFSGTLAVVLLAAPGFMAFGGRVLGGGYNSVSGRWELSSNSTNERRPNVLLVTIDSLRPDYLGAYGNRTVQTPHLDRLAEEGVRFSAATTVQPTTLPTHLSLFSGVYPATHRGRDHIGALMPEAFDTLPMVLKSAGYRTAGFYSYIGLRPEYSNLHRGFDVYRDMTQGLPPHMTDRVFGETSRLLKRVLEEVPLANVAEHAVAATTGLEERLWDRAELATDAAVEWLAVPADSPFFLWVHYFDPHYPYTAPGQFLRMYSRGDASADGDWPTIRFLQQGGQAATPDVDAVRVAYAGEVTYTDREVGRLFEHLRQTGVWDRTLTIVLADHGQALGEGGAWFHNQALTTVMTAIPLLMSYPAALPPGTVDAAVQTIDVMPTILEAAGIAGQGRIEGMSLLPLSRGLQEDKARRTVAERGDRKLAALRQGDWKLVLNLENQRAWLYNLREDPAEQSDLSGQRPEVREQLLQALQEWRRTHP